MSATEIRLVEPGEVLAFIRSVHVPFLDPPPVGMEDEPWVERTSARIEPDRAWVAVDGDRFVANGCVYTMDVTVPAAPGRDCPVLPMGGVSAVGVHPTHRRRGYLTEMMALMLDDGRRRGEPLAGLIASESVIYGRFGFGSATDSACVHIDTRRAAMRFEPARPTLRLLDRAEAAKFLPELFERLRRRRPGEVSMHPTRWTDLIQDDHHDSGERGRGLFFVAGDEGYAVYRARTEDERGQLGVTYLGGATAEFEAGLWRFLFDIDLVDRVTAYRRPVDEPLRWRLADPRQLHFDAIEDRLHLRILDMSAAFEGRGYQAEGRMVLEVVPPPLAGDAEDPVPGRWVLDVGPDGASCRRAAPGVGADLRLDVTALGALYMGGHRASVLAASGAVEELRPGALGGADRLLAAGPAPLTVVGF
jgi:predicted acetyltransferase